MREMFDEQAPRPYRTHSTPVAAENLLELADRLARAGATYRLDEPEDDLPFYRLWVGRSAEKPGAYDAAADGGLFLEFVPSDSFGFPSPDTAPPPRPTTDAHPMRRIAARTMLTEDLSVTLAALEKNLGWTPGTSVESNADGFAVEIGFDHPYSASLRVVQPRHADCATGQYLGDWGPGPYGITLTTDRFEQVADNIAASGIRCHESFTSEARSLMPDYTETFGVQFEIRGIS
jgi:hypothetical protein